MIYTCFASYCDRCEHFEVKQDDSQSFADGKPYSSNFKLRCEHEDICADLYHRLTNDDVRNSKCYKRKIKENKK